MMPLIKQYSINDTPWNRFRTVLLLRLSKSRIARLWNAGYCDGVYIVSSKLCVKSSPVSFASLSEAVTMRYVASHTSIPVPHVYASFVRNDTFYILMERVAGERLAEGWAARSDESRAIIISQLRSMVQELRSLRPPTGIGIADVVGGPAFDSREAKDRWGPYSTIADFHLALRHGKTLEQLDAEKQYVAPRYYSLYEEKRQVIEWHSNTSPVPVFTHGDLTAFNIMAQGDTVTAIVDWATAGWWPFYWEYCTAQLSSLNPLWSDAVDGFIEPCPQDYCMDMLRRRFWGQFTGRTTPRDSIH